MRKFILADNQDVTRAGMISFIKEIEMDEDVYADVIIVDSYSELIKVLRQNPDSVVIVDYSLFDFTSIDQMLNIKSGAGGSTWLLFADEPNDHFLRQLLQLDSSFSVVLKGDSKAQIMDALLSVIANGVYWCDYADSVMKLGVLNKKVPDSLTASEKSILRGIALGKSTKEIADEKNLSFHTVNAHRRNIYRKLGVNSINEATRYALQSGLIDLMEYYI